MPTLPLTPAEGTTSAHAENTPLRGERVCGDGNYLRARGEYIPLPPAPGPPGELPPRTRRIPQHGASTWLLGGTTSAHAENTHLVAELVRESRNYLRARGEYSSKLP